MRSACILLALLTMALLRPSVLFAELKMPAIWGNDMILQRDKPVPVWGRADAGAEITVEFAGQKKVATADNGGKWMVTLDPMQACCEPKAMTITSSLGNQKLKIKNVLVGDVWLCSGQSNMAMTVDGKTGWLYIGGVARAKEEVTNSANPLIRQFYVDWKVDTTPADDCTGRTPFRPCSDPLGPAGARRA